MSKNFTREPVCCAVCKRQAQGIGYSPKMGAPIAWICDSPECAQLGRIVYHMPVKALSSYEAYSLSDAGDAGGEYLDSIGKFNLAELDREEWLTFLKTIFTTYEKKMRERLLAHDAPF